jgi:hypothetical protein
VRSAWYALSPGGWRDYVTLLHVPYTLWHLAYVVVGAALEPELHAQHLGLALGAFFLALGVGAHALDELVGRPLQTRIPRAALVGLAAASIAGAVGIGIGYAVAVDAWIVPFVAAGGFLVVAYNLELAGGRFHGDAWFALGWGAFPLLTGYFAAAGTVSAPAVVAAAFAALLSLAQRRLSTVTRRARRQQGEAVPEVEAVLALLAAATVALAVALVLARA